jgi:hypothetical protein
VLVAEGDAHRRRVGHEPEPGFGVLERLGLVEQLRADRTQVLVVGPHGVHGRRRRVSLGQQLVDGLDQNFRV